MKSNQIASFQTHVTLLNVAAEKNAWFEEDVQNASAPQTAKKVGKPKVLSAEQMVEVTSTSADFANELAESEIHRFQSPIKASAKVSSWVSRLFPGI